MIKAPKGTVYRANAEATNDIIGWYEEGFSRAEIDLKVLRRYGKPAKFVDSTLDNYFRAQRAKAERKEQQVKEEADNVLRSYERPERGVVGSNRSHSDVAADER